MEVKKTIDPNKKYNMPPSIKVVKHRDSFLVIAPETAKWIVLDNDEQFDFFELLRNYTLQDSLNRFKGDYNNAQHVVIQLEARRFEDTRTIIKTDDGIMQLYLTNSCNLRCPHCYMVAGEKKKDELTIAEIKELLYNYKKYDGKTVVFTGGEVCMHPHLYDIIFYSHEVGLNNEILSNGTMWTDEMIEKVSPLIQRIQISIDGYSEEENAKVRGRYNFDRSLNTIDKFLRRKVLVDVAITPLYSSSLKTNYKKYIAFARNLKKKYEKYNFNIRFTSEMLDGREVHLSKEEKQDYKEIMGKIINECFEDYADIPFINFHKMDGIEMNCDYGNLTVACNGDVYFCPQVSRLQSVVNLREVDFSVIADMAEKARELSSVNNLMPCKECELKHICGGDCRINFFEVFRNCDIEKLASSTPTRICNSQVKEEYYDLMIRTNKKLFR